MSLDKGRFKITPHVFYKRFADKFILDRDRPWWYVNFHTTYSYGAEIQTEFDWEENFLIFGLAAREEKITSTNLGCRERSNEAVFSVLDMKINECGRVNAGIRQDYFEGWGWETLPSASARYYLTQALKLRTSVNKLFRIPTYTELYYDSPANKGNEDLSAERGWSYEWGIDYGRDNFRLEVTSFLRKEKEVIDWSRESLSDFWQVRNVSRLDTQGLEAQIFFDLAHLKERLFISSFDCGYAYVYASHTQEANYTKYCPDYLKHNAHLTFNLDLPFGISQGLMLNYEQRVNRGPSFLLDSKISKKIEKDNFIIEFFVSATNLLNTSYSEAGGVSMPGRWCEGGVSIAF